MIHVARSIAVLVSLVLTNVSIADPSAPGVSIDHPESKWRILMTPEGYSDVAFDKRAGFIDREYLSGEWAAAIHYTGGGNPTEAIWFRKVFAFPCWETNSNFTVTQEMTFDTPPQNADGADRLFSKIANGDVEITIRYEMVKTTAGIAQGTERNSTGGAGTFTLSNPYVLQQTYEVKNLTGSTLTNVRFYQFLHGLNTGIALQDNRDYGGEFGDYSFDSTQTGVVKGFNKDTGEIFNHLDTVCMHAKQTPTEFEVGYYGVDDGTDDHREGKPSQGVHFSVEAHSLNGVDFFSPPEERWVSGAMCFALSDLAPDATASVDVLLTVSTTSNFLAPRPEIEILASGGYDSATNEMVIDFQEMTNAPVDGFILRRSMNHHPGDNFPDDWPQVSIPRTLNVPVEGASRFRAPVTPGDPRGFYVVEAIINE